MENFKDLKIIDLDVAITQQSPTASGLRYMYLKLSDCAPPNWGDIFN